MGAIPETNRKKQCLTEAVGKWQDCGYTSEWKRKFPGGQNHPALVTSMSLNECQILSYDLNGNNSRSGSAFK